MPIVVHHRSWVYLIHWLDLKEIGSLEPKPGVPPTSGHQAGLLETLKVNPAKAVIRAPFQDARPSEWLVKQDPGMVMVELPYTVGDSAESGDLFGLFDASIVLLLGAQQ
jgi:zinc/manganese transport system substrate-binding protein